MATIREIAYQAGVAVSTVSNVLNHPNGKVKAGDKTRERILAVAARMHYSPSIMAKGLREGKSYLVSVLRQDFTSYFVADVISAAEDIFHHNDYHLLMTSFTDPADCRTRIQHLLQKNIDGIIIATTIFPEFMDIFEEYSAKIPMVNLFSKSPLAFIPSVYVNGSMIGRLAAEYLKKLNHQKILLCGDRLDSIEAFIKSSENQLEIFTLPDYHSFEDGRAVIKFICNKKLPVTAVFAYNDENAAGIIYEATQRGIRIPEKLSVIGVNNSAIGRMISPLLTTVGQPLKEQGASAAKLLLNMITRAETSLSDVVLEPFLVERDSCTLLNNSKRRSLP